MRTIKFRGKRTDNGEWIYGSLLTDPVSLETEISDWNSVDYSRHEVEPITVGQFIGMQDSDGNDIYEGDICALSYDSGEVYMDVVHSYSHFGFRIKGESTPGCADALECWILGKRVKVIGNIHDNIELISDRKLPEKYQTPDWMLKDKENENEEI